MQTEGILLVDKPAGLTSFSVIARLRKIFHVKTMGHAGTLDPFATGVLVVLIGRNFTRLQDQFLVQDKEYVASVRLGTETDTYDLEGTVTCRSDKVPTHEEVVEVINKLQGEMDQLPPMFSAKKVAGRRLYELARKGKEVERKPSRICIRTTLLRYEYPDIELHFSVSKGTYIRTLAFDIGRMLGCCAHLHSLRRTRAGVFSIEQCLTLDAINAETALLKEVSCK